MKPFTLTHTEFILGNVVTLLKWSYEMWLLLFYITAVCRRASSLLHELTEQSGDDCELQLLTYRTVLRTTTVLRILPLNTKHHLTISWTVDWSSCWGTDVSPVFTLKSATHDRQNGLCCIWCFSRHVFVLEPCSCEICLYKFEVY